MINPHSRTEASEFDDEVIDLRQVAHAVWHHRLLVVLCVLAGGALGLGLSFLSTTWVSQGLLLTPGVKMSDFKRYQVAFSSLPAFKSFVELAGYDEVEAQGELKRLLEAPDELNEAVRPEFAYTDRDAKRLGVKFDDAGSIVGLSLRLRQRDPADVAPVLLMAEYFRDTMIRVDLRKELLQLCATNQIRDGELRNEQLDAAFAIEQHKAKVEALKSIIARNPQASTIDSRQVVSLENGGERFLSPLAQMVGVETLIADVQLDEHKRLRDRTLTQLRSRYYCAARDALEGHLLGKAFLDGLQGVLDKTFEGVDRSVETHERAYNEFSLQRDRWRSRYIERTRFVSSPEGGSIRVRRPGPVLGVVLGVGLGAFAGVFFALFAAWWRRNRQSIIADEA